ncbi:UNVERIFIED_CONTAM: hypothetical protein RMT77_000766 [Armadillidium vulgare]
MDKSLLAEMHVHFIFKVKKIWTAIFAQTSFRYIRSCQMVVNGKNTDGVPTQEQFSLNPSPVLEILQKCNSFFIQGLRSIHGECIPLIACGRQVGMIRPDVAYFLEKYPDVFTATPTAFYLNPEFTTYESRTQAIDIVLRDLRVKSNLIALRGWRDECFNVWSDFGSEPLFKIERSASTVLGTRAFGIHITGYTRQPDGSTGVWLQKRSATKPTWPGMFDSMVGGGITAGLKASEVVIKEAEEEASIPREIIQNAVPVGTVSFFTETERGLHANSEFVYDLELPNDFIPKNSDGEVEGFELVPVQELLSRVLSSKYKLTSAPIAINFLLRNGLINPDNEPNIPAVQELLHLPLHHIYRQWPSSQFTPSPLPSSLSFSAENATSSNSTICIKA